MRCQETKIEFQSMASGGIKRKLDEQKIGKWITFEMLIGGKVFLAIFKIRTTKAHTSYSSVQV